MNIPKSLRWIIRYLLHTFAVAAAGCVPATLYLAVLFFESSRATVIQTLSGILVAGAACFVFVLFPLCAFAAVPLTIAINRFVRLTLLRTMGLALILAAPGIVYLDYFNHRSSGVDSGPPAEPYSVAHLISSLASPEYVFMMVVIPVSSALLAAWVLWRLRFRSSR